MSPRSTVPAFGAATKAPSAQSAQATPSRATETMIEKKVRLIEKAEAHFDKHRDRWVATRYQVLLKKDAPAPSLKPLGAVEDRTTRLMRAAIHMADRKQFGRIRSIERAGLKTFRRDLSDRLER